MTKLYHQAAFTVAGLLIEASDPSLCPTAWTQLFETYDPADLEALGNGQAYGLCLPQTSQPGIHYLAGYQVTDLIKAEKLGLTIYQVPEAHYLTIPVKGPLPQSIQESWAKIWQEILPNSDHKLANSPLLEVYSDQDPTSSDYQMAIWLPIDQNH